MSTATLCNVENFCKLKYFSQMNKFIITLVQFRIGYIGYWEAPQGQGTETIGPLGLGQPQG